ncbi:hypothetical protein J437_LFUL002754 [Ladona fulva]|uniref:BAR domain-containing protein n=1 Tax=Ladona fulva TaxID=123851 RepID=A0A8K0NV11_LADFU|nr:hypothetical protein J437_LFUL002754 [Ladona fulva]
MGLQPLEFTDCLSDSPYFRENLHAHEQVLEKTSQQIKGLIKEVKDLINAAQKTKRKFTVFLAALRGPIYVYAPVQISESLAPRHPLVDLRGPESRPTCDHSHREYCFRCGGKASCFRLNPCT